MDRNLLSLNDHILRPDFHMDGAAIIEASAGTGKTYQIQTLYLRLIVERGYSVRNVLVVTFTEAATKELRDRLRAILHACQLELDGTLPAGHGDAGRVREVLAMPLQNRHPDVELATELQVRVRRALMDFDLATIFTIHGFCHRVLTRYAFECGNEFGLELTTDSRGLIDEVCEDWWRRELYPADGPAQVLRLLPSFSLSALARHVQSHIEKPDALMQPASLTATAARSTLTTLAAQIHDGVDAVLAGPFIANAEYEPTAEGRALLQALARTSALFAAGQTSEAMQAAQPLALALQKNGVCVRWQAPAAYLAFAAACGDYVAALPEKTRAPSLTWEAGAIRIKGEAFPALDAAVERLRATWPAADAVVARVLADPNAYPRKESKKAAGIVDAAMGFAGLLANSQSGKAADFHNAVKALADFESSVLDTVKASQLLPAALQDAFGEIAATVPQVLTAVIGDIAKSFHARRLERRLLTFGDLLLDLRAALADGAGGKVLRDILRREFRAGLIDEFQDTDPVQYDIFRTLLIDAGLPVYLVGDPKQAIYGFRSGDIHTYYGAVDHVAERAADAPAAYSLDTNFRAESALVGAVNAMFCDEPENRAFVNEHIDYPGTLKAFGKDADEALLVAGEVDLNPLKLWYYSEPVGAGKDSPFARQVYADVATEIVRLLDDESLTRGGKCLSASDIAILVLSHDEGEMIYRELASRGVPVVRQKTGNVFDSTDAADLELLLMAMSAPTDITLVRSALATSLLDVTDADIIAMESGERVRLGTDDGLHTMDDYLEVFRTANDRWRRRSFVEAFNYVAKRTAMRVHLVRQPEGERHVTNVLQLVDLLHHAAVERRLGPEGCIHWLLRQRDAEAREQSDAYEMRLETDDAAVRIMTVFRSKGLQFPVVFVPTMWRRNPQVRGPAQYHRTVEGDGGEQLVVDFAPDADAAARAVAEQHEEDIRLFYVAATRAVNRAYVVWGRLESNNSPLQHVLDNGRLSVAAAAATMTTETCFLNPITDAAAADEPARGGVELRLIATNPLPDSRRYRGRSADFTAADLQTTDLRDGRPVVVDKSFAHSSFTGLTARHGSGHAQADHYDFDATDEPTDTDDTAEPTGPVPAIFQFPAGAHTGECWHRIFERLDYPAMHPDASPEQHQEAETLVATQLAVFGLCTESNEREGEQRRAVVTDMVRQTLQMPLPTHDGATFRLCDIPAADRKAEFVFDFPLARWEEADTPNTLASMVTAVTDHWPADADEPWRAVYVQRLRELGSGFAGMRIPRGYMTGSIDLLFRRDGRYYIVDWKSNRRGGVPGDFDAAGLHEEMADHLYFLQYLIYTVATHQYLRGALGDRYDYHREFGGAYYVFLRAVDAANPGRGVFHDRPPLALIEALSRVLGNFTDGRTR